LESVLSGPEIDEIVCHFEQLDAKKGPSSVPLEKSELAALKFMHEKCIVAVI